MARVKRGVAAKKRHMKVLKQAKGYYGNKSRSFRAANEQVLHSGQYAFRDRRAKKGEFRRLWIQRINAACRLPENEISYSRFIAGLNAAGIEFRVLKGCATAHLDYPDPSLRLTSDVDLLVRQGQLGAATEVLRLLDCR